MSMFYESHAWAQARKSCEIFARLGSGKRPSAGETLVVETADGDLPLRVESCHREDEGDGGLLALVVLNDQAATVEQLTKGVRISRVPRSGRE